MFLLSLTIHSKHDRETFLEGDTEGNQLKLHPRSGSKIDKAQETP